MSKLRKLFILFKTTFLISLTTNTGYGLSFKTDEIPLVGAKASGVKGMKLKDDYVVSVNNFDYNKHEYISIMYFVITYNHITD